MPLDKNVVMGKGVKIPYPKLVNMYGCLLGDKVFVGPFVEIQKGVVIGEGARISSHSFICAGVTIGKKVFVAHGVMFINDLFNSENLETWELKKTIVGDHVRIGSNATILPVKIGEHAIIGAGSVVTKDVPSWTIVAGNPARVIRTLVKHEVNTIS